MDASTHTFGSHPVEDFRAARIRKARPGHAVDTGVATRAESAFAPERVSGEHMSSASRSIRTCRRPGKHVEHALFAVTLGAIGYLWLGVCLAQSA